MQIGYDYAMKLLLAALVVVGCTKTNPLDCSDGTCSDPTHPYCDRDGTVGGTPNACVAVSCDAPAAFVKCAGDTAVSCNAAGDGYDLIQCSMGCSAEAKGCNMCTPNASYCTAAGIQHCGPDGAPTTLDACASGCTADPTPHCTHIVPRYVGSACDTPANDDLVIASSATLGTDLDTACTGGIIQQTAAPEICVVRNKHISISAGATLRVTGARLLALVADDALDIHGTLDASADFITPGPGACDRTSGNGPTNTVGGGGAGFKTAGGAGGTATTDGGANNGGPVDGDPAQLAVLVGGACAVASGAGGGGVTLVACRGPVTIDGTVDLGGGGGAGGLKVAMTNTIIGAHGGGSGGYLVIQAFDIILTGGLFANGGAGGAGYTGSATGNRGADASLSSTYGASGGIAQSGEGAGGTGGFGSSAGAAGKHPVSSGTAGAGGGGVGYLQTYTPQGVTPTLTPTDVSPPLQPNLTIPTM